MIWGPDAMLTLLPLFLFPPWKALSSRQRRHVWQACIQPLLIRWPAMLAKTLLLFFVLMAVSDRSHGWRQYLLIIAAVLFAIDVFEMILVAGIRQKVGAYIQEHGSEIQSVA